MYRIFDRDSMYRIIVLLLSTAITLTSCLSKRNGRVLINKGQPSSTKSVSTHSKRNIISDASALAKSYPVKGDLLTAYADMLGVAKDDLQNPYLYAAVHDWMGTPYKIGGIGKNGIDCSAFAATIMKDVYGKVIPRSSFDQANVITRKYERQLKEGDLVFFKFGSSKINHVGIYLNNNKFVHASTKSGVIISDLKDRWYYRYFKRAGTVK